VALVFAARLRGVPIILAEQNVLPGRANKLLAKMATRILLTFEETRAYLPKGIRATVMNTGTPLRAAIHAALKQAKPKKKAGDVHLLIFGGSQGARIMADVLPEALALLPLAQQAHVHIAHQVRAEDLARTQAAYAPLKLASLTLKTFFEDMPEQYLAADILIGRSGTGTLLEAAAFGLPAIYVPLELADGHQKLNAAVAERAGAAIVLPQAYFTPANLLVQIQSLWQDMPKRAAMATAAKTLGNPHATRDVANAIEDTLENVIENPIEE
jgi:UDP-N-acetylglucosamine--N-acetylmuramyl-(pentapeptide) pyrophosphoryl-undecaprenol N-acetylglucosamine transferase